MTFLELAKKVLKDEGHALTYKEIWKIAERKNYIKDLKGKGKTPWNTMAAQLYMNVRDNKNSEFKKVSDRPAKFCLKNNYSKTVLKKQEITDIKKIDTNKFKKFEFLEKELNPFLSYFAFHNLKCYTKTISHSLSSKKEFGEWVHPDIVGCNFLFEGWENDVLELKTSIGEVSIKLYSFELKRELNASNLRESFFQTVSNSSWANEGYLVTSKISENIMNELSRLSSSFGIGVILLDINKVELSEVILPTRFKENLDWEMIKKLASMNENFKEFIKRIKNDISNKEVVKERYNNVLDFKKLKIKNKSVKNYL